MQITRFGHAALLVEVGTTRILIDPGTLSVGEVFELDGLDAIIVTHQHPDHLDQSRAPALIERNPDAVLLCDPETASLVDFGSWRENADGLEISFPGLTVRGVGSQHAPILPSIPRIGNVGVLLTEDGGSTLFHPGDAYEYAPEGVDVLALPLSAPWAKSSETVDFVQRISPTTFFPIHDCTTSPAGHASYWAQVSGHGGVEDARLLGQTDSTTV